MKKVFFCYLDVLGFKGKLLNKTESEQVDIINSLFSYISFSVPGNFIAEPEKNKSLIDLESINTNSILISDSILMWTENSDYTSIVEFIYRIQRLIRNAFVGGFPLRGTIEYGLIYHQEKSIPTKSSYNHYDLIVGSALMNAYKSEQSFEWMGCTLGSSCLEIIQNVITAKDNLENFKDHNLFKNNILIEYEAPQKSGAVEKLFTVNWIDMIIQSIYKKNEVETLFMMHTESPKISWEVKRKIDYTNKYIDYVIANKLNHKLIGTTES